MSQRRKRVERILKRPKQMKFAEVEELLEDFGMHCIRSTGSHFWFQKKGLGQISIPKKGGRYVEKVYLDEVIRVLDLENLDLDQLD